MKTAVCDSDAFYPLRELVEGPLKTLDTLPTIERFVRTVVLHDQMIMEITPWAYDEESDAERKRQGQKMAIVGMGPAVSGFEFIQEGKRLPPSPEILLSDSQLAIARECAGAGVGNLWFENHVGFLKRILGLIERGDGSALLLSSFGVKAMAAAEQYPELLFKELDKDWQQFAEKLRHGRFGFQVPPVLGIVLSRCAKREAIPTVIKDLRDEWADARNKVWALLDQLRKCRTIGEARNIERELTEASQLFAPKRTVEIDSTPIRILREIIAAGVVGGVVARSSRKSARPWHAYGSAGTWSRTIGGTYS